MYSNEIECVIAEYLKNPKAELSIRYSKIIDESDT